ALELDLLPANPTPAEDAVITARLWATTRDNQTAALREQQSDGPTPSGISEPPETLRVLMPDGTVVVMSLEEYLKGVVPAEVPASWPAEALRAQAVAARCYAATRHAHLDVGADVCTKDHCQVWTSRQYDSTNAAIEATRGVVATYAGQIITAFFSAHCDGHTRNSEDVWKTYLPYCRSVSCPCGFDFLYGHGVGMCQEGSRVLAQQGRTYEEIIKHYYTGVEVNVPSPGRISGAGVTPTSGDTHTWFTLAATFRSADGLPPVLAYVLIDGRAYSLLPDWSSASPAGAPTTTTGYTYVYRTQLPVGEHLHRFVFVDRQGMMETAPASGDTSGPIVSAASGPPPTPTPQPVEACSLTASTFGDFAGGTFDNVSLAMAYDGELQLPLDSASGVYTSEVLSVPLHFIGVAATWYAHVPPGAALQVEVRRGFLGGAWGGWTALPASEDDALAAPEPAGGGRLYSSDLVLGEGDALQYRVSFSAADASPSLHHLRVVCIDARDGPSEPQLGGTSEAASASPTIVARAAWGADERYLHWPAAYGSPKAIILHHSAAPQSEVDGATALRALYYYHSVIREWGDIGYQYVVDANGVIYEGRAGGAGVIGAHTALFDAATVGVALLGDLHTSPPPQAQQDGLVALLAYLCATNNWSPLGTVSLLSRTLPVIMAHRDCADTVCPGDAAVDLLPALRAATAQAMGLEPPQIALLDPAPDALVRAVVVPSLVMTGTVASVDFYVDDTLAGTADRAPWIWRWSTVGLADGVHHLRVTARNELGSASAETQVQVDNSAPSGGAVAPEWSRSLQVPFALSGSDVVSVQFSNGWVWEGEQQYHATTTGRVVADPQALNDIALQGRAGHEVAGAWFGPFTCALPWPSAYEACFRLKTPERTPEIALAELDVADIRGARRYAQRGALYAGDLAVGGAYDEVRLSFDYAAQPPTCAIPGESDGLEFRTAYSGTADLYLDRVTVFTGPQPFQSVITWTVAARDGDQVVTVRLRDAAGNAQDHAVAVRVDRDAPEWLSGSARVRWVCDTVSGLDPSGAVCALSTDEGATWGGWLPLELTAESAVTVPVQLVAPDPSELGIAATHVRFRVADIAGNVALSAPQPLTAPPTRDVLLPLILRQDQPTGP
ncbi:MAG: SpoIID/LytB domain-containing protein, partial [Chloroflexi bacterium]|nr:SpoIID/LytB domain-containing protein [Chloroflexota bacterium]